MLLHIRKSANKLNLHDSRDYKRGSFLTFQRAMQCGFNKVGILLYYEIALSFKEEEERKYFV